MAKIITVTSGKGGVGKTTTAASFATGLALRGYKTIVVDFDIGMRNIDLVMGCNGRVVYDIINVLAGRARLSDAIIRDRRIRNLYVLPAGQVGDQSALSDAGVSKILDGLIREFDYVICDSPAGIGNGTHLAMHFADEVLVITNPEMSSVRDAEQILSMLADVPRRANGHNEPIGRRLVVTRYSPRRVSRGEMLSLDAITGYLKLPVLGVVPESGYALKCVNTGQPIVLEKTSDAGQAYQDMVGRYMGEAMPMRFVFAQRKGLLRRVLRR